MKSKQDAIEPGQLVRPFVDPRPGRSNHHWLYEKPWGDPVSGIWHFAEGIPPWGAQGDRALVLRLHRDGPRGLYLELLWRGRLAWAYRGWVEPIG